VENILQQSKKPWYSLFWDTTPTEEPKPTYLPLPENPDPSQYQSAYMYHYPQTPENTYPNEWTATSYQQPVPLNQQEISQQYWQQMYSQPPQLYYPEQYDPASFQHTNVDMQKFSAQDALRPNNGQAPTIPIREELNETDLHTTSTEDIHLKGEMNVTSSVSVSNPKPESMQRQKRNIRMTTPIVVEQQDLCSMFKCRDTCHQGGYQGPACLPICKNNECFCLCKPGEDYTYGGYGMTDQEYTAPQSVQVMYSTAVKYADDVENP